MGKQLVVEYQCQNHGDLYHYLNKSNVNTVALPSVRWDAPQVCFEPVWVTINMHLLKLLSQWGGKGHTFILGSVHTFWLAGMEGEVVFCLRVQLMGSDSSSCSNTALLLHSYTLVWMPEMITPLSPPNPRVQCLSAVLQHETTNFSLCARVSRW